jgi:DNA invertase Pin-like site-specific DNA recombinase
LVARLSCAKRGSSSCWILASSRIVNLTTEVYSHKLGRRLTAERRKLVEELIRQGVTQAEIARELGISRQAIQKMLSCRMRFT